MIRVKHRYLLVEASEPVDEAALGARARELILRELMRQAGASYFHKVNPRIICMDSKTLTVRCSLAGLSALVVAFTMTKSVDGKPIAFYTLKSSGTIRGLNAE